MRSNHRRAHKVKCLKATISSNLAVSWHSRQVCKYHRDVHIPAKPDKDTITQVESAQQNLEGKVCIFQPNCCNIQCVDMLRFSSNGEICLCLDSAEILMCSSEENSYDHNDKLSSYNRTNSDETSQSNRTFTIVIQERKQIERVVTIASGEKDGGKNEEGRRFSRKEYWEAVEHLGTTDVISKISSNKSCK